MRQNNADDLPADRVHPSAIVAISLKMYFSNARTLDYCRALAAVAGNDDGVRTGTTDLIVLPTFVSIPAALTAFRGTTIKVGAQDLAAADTGPFTGEVSGTELAEIGCTHVEVGHAERRTLFGETDSVVAAKTRAALRNGLVPILCVGEPAPTDTATAADTCVRQVLSALPEEVAAGPASPRVIMAYEPYWAIGAPRPAPTDHVADVCRRARTALTDRVPDVAVIYGGSAGPGLLADLDDNVDGLFLGRFAHEPQAVADVLAEAAALQNRRLNTPRSG